jgi:hypothetical protein
MSQRLDERFEQLIAFLGSQLPAPVEQQSEDDGTLIFTGGAPAEVVVRLSSWRITVSEFAGVWQSPGRFRVRPRRIGSVRWARLPETALMNAVAALIKGAREARLARYRPCVTCGETNPPELLAVGGVCPPCSEPSVYRVH